MKRAAVALLRQPLCLNKRAQGEAMAEFIFSKRITVDVILDSEADAGIRKIWKKVEGDIALTTNASCIMHEACTETEQAIIIATSGCGTLSEKLEQRFQKLRHLRGQWETGQQDAGRGFHH